MNSVVMNILKPKLDPGYRDRKISMIDQIDLYSMNIYLRECFS